MKKLLAAAAIIAATTASAHAAGVNTNLTNMLPGNGHVLHDPVCISNTYEGWIQLIDYDSNKWIKAFNASSSALLSAACHKPVVYIDVFDYLGVRYWVAGF